VPSDPWSLDTFRMVALSLAKVEAVAEIAGDY
jgi:hypothetical protein